MGAQKITTFLMFEGRAEEAMTFYLSLFPDAEVVAKTTYGPGEEGAEGSVKHATFTLAGQQFMCIDSHVSHGFGFTPSMSLYVQCDSEDELDRLYARHSSTAAARSCRSAPTGSARSSAGSTTGSGCPGS